MKIVMLKMKMRQCISWTIVPETIGVLSGLHCLLNSRQVDQSRTSKQQVIARELKIVRRFIEIERFPS